MSGLMGGLVDECARNWVVGVSAGKIGWFMSGKRGQHGNLIQ